MFKILAQKNSKKKSCFSRFQISREILSHFLEKGSPHLLDFFGFIRFFSRVRFPKFLITQKLCFLTGFIRFLGNDQKVHFFENVDFLSIQGWAIFHDFARFYKGFQLFGNDVSAKTDFGIFIVFSKNHCFRQVL